MENNPWEVQIKKACNFNASNFTGEVEAITMAGEISDQTTIGVPADKLFVDKKANLLINTTAGGSTTDSSSKNRTASVSTVTQFEAAVANNNITTINVADDITTAIVATRSGSRSFTINFGTHIMGDVLIDAPAVSAITLNDSGVGVAGVDGASIEDLVIAAANAHVVNNVQVTGIITIMAVSHNTLVQQDAAFLVDMRCPGTVEFPPEIFIVGPTPPPVPPVSINTSEPVVLDGTFGSISVQQPGAQLAFVEHAQVGQLTVVPTAGGATFTTATGATIGQVRVGADATFGGSGMIGQVLAGADVTFGGSGTITSVDAMANGVHIVANGATRISTVNVIDGVTPPTITVENTASGPSGSEFRIKAAAPYTVGADPTIGVASGKITGTTTAMEYKLASADESAYEKCSATSTLVPPGTYAVRVKEAAPVLASDPVEVVVGAFVANVSNIHYAVVGNSVEYCLTNLRIRLVLQLIMLSFQRITEKHGKIHMKFL